MYSVNMNVIDSNSNAAVETSLNADERIWIDLFQRGFVGDVVACLSIRDSLETDPDVSSSRVRYNSLAESMLNCIFNDTDDPSFPIF